MAAKKKAAKAGTGAVSAAQAARSNEYVQRLVTDESLREDLRTAYESASKAYDRINGKGPQKALDDKKVQRDLKTAATSFKSATDSLRDKKPKKRKRKGGGLLLVGLVGAGLALGLSEGLRNKVLDALFGAEEEFEYTSSTTPDSAGSTSSTETVGT
jgi:opacity protein-like surface antigen